VTEQATSRRLTVQEAAEVLGTTVDAVRMRARRGSLDSEKEPDGRVYVYLNDDSSETKHRPNVEPDALISAKEETIALLREQLSEEREARRRADTIIAQLTQANAALASRVPELELPARSPVEWAEDEEYRREDEDLSTRVPEQRQSWWRRMFGA
jgi:hypothetical protein